MRDWLSDAWAALWSMTTLDVVSALATAVAAGLAWWTIRQAKSQAAEAQAALLHERRADYVLEHLTAIALSNHKSSDTGWVDAEIKIHASLVPPELIPITCAAVGLPSTAEAQAHVAERYTIEKDIHHSIRRREAVHDEIVAEISAAIEWTLASRPGSINRVSRATQDPGND